MCCEGPVGRREAIRAPSRSAKRHTQPRQNGRQSLIEQEYPPRFRFPPHSCRRHEETSGTSRWSSGHTRGGLVFQGRLVRGATVFIPARVRAMNDSVCSNGASVYRGPPPCIVVIKLLMNSLMRLGLTKKNGESK